MTQAPVDASLVGLRDAVLGGWFNAERRELAPGFAISAEDVVVDVGSGDGGIAAFCARQGAETILVDHAGPRLQGALERVQAENGPASALAGDISNLPLGDASATRIICTEVLEHVDDPVAGMRELVRIGRPGALYLLSAPGHASEQLQRRLAPAFYFEKPHHIRVFEGGAFQQLVQDAGLTIEHRGSHGFFWSVWWSFVWQEDGESRGEAHPLLDSWARTWSALLDLPDAGRIQAALNELAPKSTYVVARKPS